MAVYEENQTAPGGRGGHAMNGGIILSLLADVSHKEDVGAGCALQKGGNL